MSHEHLSEEELQRYALEGLLPDCAHCQQQISTYQAIFTYIRDAEDPIVDMLLLPEELPNVKAAERREAFYLYVLLIGSFALGITMMILCWPLITSVPAIPLTIGLLLLLAFTVMELYHHLKKYTSENIHATR